MLGGLVHGALGWPIFAAWTCVLGIWLLLVYPLDATGRLAWRALNVIWGHVLWVAIPMWTLDRRGHENIPEGPCILVANHQSVIDIPAILGFNTPTTVVASPRLFRAPIIGPFMSISRQICTDDFLDRAPEYLRNGVSVLVFAEGTRSVDGSVGRFRMGAFRLARELGVPVVPVAVDGSHHILPKGGRHPTKLRVTVRVRALPALDPADYSSDRALLNDTRQRVIEAKESL